MNIGNSEIEDKRDREDDTNLCFVETQALITELSKRCAGLVLILLHNIQNKGTETKEYWIYGGHYQAIGLLTSILEILSRQDIEGHVPIDAEDDEEKDDWKNKV